ncbi:MAG TPA: thiolase family protein [Candidatus Eubacterium avistercoris]|uniref:Acetyl-CoA acetyltransferase n=1 Tax=Candidatus Eubacterium avistercoris TaxID=2838567 RepID=A0A9D2IFG6_9FIRM|nr:thiolase family protein [Candidatus Eubacterium avistercoris]
MNREVVIVAYGRSAVCRARKGSFAGTHPIEYSAQVLKGVLDKIPQLDRADIEDVIMGCAVQHYKTSMNIAKSVVARAELPECVAGHTINRFCSSGLQAIATAANAIAAGQGDVIVAGGVEDMSGTFEPYPEEYQDPWLNEHAPGAYMAMGITAENVVKKYGLTRTEMDQMAVDSHRKAAKAQKEGKLAPSIIPVTVVDENGNEKVVTEDEGIRPNTNLETLATLKPCFIPETGTVTAATSSQTSDAAAFVVLMEAEKAKSLGIKPIAKLVSFAVAGCDATMMGLGPIYAVPKAMKRAGLTVDDMDVIELNEAFAAQAIPCIRELKLNPEKVNPYGGAMALGHPMGATGAFLTCKALDYLQDNNGKYGLVTMCIGGGMGAAGIFELV